MKTTLSARPLSRSDKIGCEFLFAARSAHYDDKSIRRYHLTYFGLSEILPRAPVAGVEAAAESFYRRDGDKNRRFGAKRRSGGSGRGTGTGARHDILKDAAVAFIPEES